MITNTDAITHSDLSFGPDSHDRRAEAGDPGLEGALAALETFYYALNNRDAEALAAVVSDHALAQLNNPVGGILRGGDAIVELYASKIFRGRVKVEVRFGDFVQYLGEHHAVFAGRETGTYTVDAGEPRPLTIRTSRYFRYDTDAGKWLQLHHHGSIDDAELLGAYQKAVLG
jgi:ketosteroid isomerase-like protein